jgi:hypothetical protein
MLERQRKEIAVRAERAAAILRAIDVALAALPNEGGKTMNEMSKEEITELFEGFDPSQYEDEVKERWGQTDAYKESARRAAKYTKADWERFKAESHAIMTDASRLFLSGAAVDADERRLSQNGHRLSIDRWFYSCGPTMHAGLADMYEADERFASSIDKYAPGLTSWWSSAIRANASGRGKEAAT